MRFNCGGKKTGNIIVTFIMPYTIRSGPIHRHTRQNVYIRSDLNAGCLKLVCGSKQLGLFIAFDEKLSIKKAFAM